MECEELARRLDEAYRNTAARFPQPGVRMEQVRNKAGQEVDTLVLTALDKVEEPERQTEKRWHRENEPGEPLYRLALFSAFGSYSRAITARPRKKAQDRPLRRNGMFTGTVIVW